MDYTPIDTETIYHGRAFTVQRARFRLPDGRTAAYDVVEHSGAVTVLPLDAEGRIWFVRQFRPAIGKNLLELPAGTKEPSEPAEDCALREIREETGFAAGTLQLLGTFYLAPGYSTEFMHVFLARELTPAPLSPDDDEFLKAEPIPLQQAYRMVTAGEIQDGKTLAALLLAEPYIRRGSSIPDQKV